MGIWDNQLIEQIGISREFRLSKDEGDTDLENYFIKGQNLFIKREDKNPTGSQKDRGLAFQISAHLAEGKDDFYISSSGNSALSAINLLKGRLESLTVYLSPKISEPKIKRIQKTLGMYITRNQETELGNIKIRFSSRAVSDAFKEARDSGGVLLRGSQDEFGYQGYMSISDEIADDLPDCTDIFIPSSSGTTAYGIYKGYMQLKDVSNRLIPRFHICQTTYVNILVRDLAGVFKKTEKSIADSIVDKVGHRKSEIEQLIDDTNGRGWIISDSKIEEAYKLFGFEKENLSFESGLVAAAYLQAIENGHEMSAPLILVTGMRELK